MDYLIAPERHAVSEFILRSYLPGDGAALGEAVTSSYEHLAPFMAWARREQSVEESERLARSSRGRWLLAEDFAIGIFARDDATVLGGCGFHLREGPLSGGCAEIGMWIRASHAGQGLGTRVLQALLEWGFETWPWQRLSWRCDVRNLASMRVAQKCGMAQEGLLRGQLAETGGRRDTVCFGALRGE